MSEYQPKFGDPIRFDQIADPRKEKEHMHRLVQQLSPEEYLELSEDSLEKVHIHTKECNDCDIKLRDFANQS